VWPRVPACPCSAVMMPQRRQWGAFVSPWAPGCFPFFPLLNIMSLYQVRPAVARDAATIAAIHVNTWQEAYEGLLPEADLKAISVDKRLKLWREAIQYGDPQVHVAVDGDRIVGFVGFDRSATRSPSPPPARSGRSTSAPATGIRAPAWRCGTPRARGLWKRAVPRSRCG
jgi:hypothetical protein